MFSSHFSQTFHANVSSSDGLGRWLDEFGNAGVDLFFVLSGFVIAMSISNRKTSDAAHFLLGRAKRLLPVYWIITAAASIVILGAEWAGVQFEIPKFSLTHLTASLTFTSQLTGQGFPIVAQGWSLEFEVAFYLLAGLCLFGVANPKARLGALLVILMVLSVLVNPMFFEFGLGVLCFLIYSALKAKGLGQTTWLSTIAAFSGLIALVVIGSEGLSERHIAWGIPAAFIVGGLSLSGFSSTPRLATLVGQASYPFYLLQWITLPITARFMPELPHSTLPLQYLTVLFLTFLLAAAMSTFLDEPIKSWLTKKGF